MTKYRVEYTSGLPDTVIEADVFSTDPHFIVFSNVKKYETGGYKDQGYTTTVSVAAISAHKVLKVEKVQDDT